jgi:hypothetical protein
MKLSGQLQKTMHIDTGETLEVDDVDEITA